MKYYTIPVSERLKDYISLFWVSDFAGGFETPYTYLSTADSLCKLVFIFRKPAGGSGNYALYSAGLQGQTHLFGAFPTIGNFEIFGINLFPHAIPLLFSLPATDLTNQLVDVETLLGKSGKELNEKMAEARNVFERLKIVEDFFEKRLSGQYIKDATIDSAIRLIRSQQGKTDVKMLADYCCLSTKQFERRFRVWTGFTPKLYTRILRFENVLCRYHSLETLTETAFQCGYFDQAHLIRDFKEFTGYSPTKYFSMVRA
jgi:AraC-like DNA-binding protein